MFLHDGEKEKGLPVSTNYRCVKIGQDEKTVHLPTDSANDYGVVEGERQTLSVALRYLIL